MSTSGGIPIFLSSATVSPPPLSLVGWQCVISDLVAAGWIGRYPACRSPCRTCKSALLDKWLHMSSETPVKKIEDTFKELTSREDIAILLINQHVSPSGGLVWWRFIRISTQQ
jgi:hypothetical protein